MDFRSQGMESIMKIKWIFILSDIIFLFVAYMLSRTSAVPILTDKVFDAGVLLNIRMILIGSAVISYLIGTKIIKLPERADYHQELTPEIFRRARSLMMIKISLFSVPVVAGFTDFILIGQWGLLAGGIAIGIIGKFAAFLKLKDL